MLPAAAVLFGSFLLSSLYLQNVLAPARWRRGSPSSRWPSRSEAGVHAASHSSSRGVRIPLARGFTVTAAGMLLLSGAGAGGQLRRRHPPRDAGRRPRPRIILVAVSVAVLTGAGRTRAGCCRA